MGKIFSRKVEIHNPISSKKTRVNELITSWP